MYMANEERNAWVLGLWLFSGLSAFLWGLAIGAGMADVARVAGVLTAFLGVSLFILILRVVYLAGTRR